MNRRAPSRLQWNGAIFFFWIAMCALPLAGQAIPQKFLGDVTHPPDFAPRFKPIEYKGATIRYDESAWEKFFNGETTVRFGADEITELHLTVSGKDKKGRPWTVYILPPREIAPGYAWAADLNRDGTEELIFAMSQAGNGRCIGRSNLTIISFDAEGRPVPWFVSGFIHSDDDWETKIYKGTGIKDFGDWNKNGQTELVQFDCEWDSSKKVDEWFSIADVYELNTSFWRRLSPKDRTKNASQYRKFAATVEDVIIPKKADTFVPDYSNDPASGINAQTVAEVPASGGEDCGVMEGLKVEDGRIVERSPHEKQQVHARCNYHFVGEDGVNCFGKPSIVLYSSTETIAIENGNSSQATELLEKVVREKLPVRLTGQMEEGRCSPAMLWATMP